MMEVAYKYKEKGLTEYTKLLDYLEDTLKFPLEIHLESSSRCNSHCITCPRDKMMRELGELDRSLFKKAVEETANYKMDFIHLHLNGEPLFLDVDDLVWRINYAKKLNPDATVDFSTNASLLDEEKANKILTSKLDLIMISVDGGNKEDYEKCRKGLNWDTLIKNVTYLVKRKREFGSCLYIQTGMIPLKQNISSLKEYYKVFQDIGVDHTGGSGVQNIGGLIDSNSMRTYLQYNKGDINSPCWRLFCDLSIFSDGRATVCCQDVVGFLPIGDLHTQSLKEIWQGEVMTSIRDKFIYGKKNEIPFCNRCDFMVSFVAPDYWKIPKEEWIQIYEKAKDRAYRSI